MAKDILIDIKEHDLLMTDTANQNEPCFDVSWNGTTCNINIPSAYASMVQYDSDGVFACRVKIPYKPLYKEFTIAVLVNGGTTAISGGKAQAYLFGSMELTTLKASQLPMIDRDGVYLIVFKRGAAAVTIYSGKSSDLLVGEADNQSAQLLALCAPGKNYRYPTTGIDITKYLNSVVEYTDLQSQIESQYAADGKTVQSAGFDSMTGDLETVFSPEDGEDGGENLLPVSQLDTDFLEQFTDEFIRTTLNVKKLKVFGFQTIFNNHENFIGIVFFPTSSKSWKRLADTYKSAIIGTNGAVTTDSTHYVVTASVKAGSVIIFNMSNVSLAEKPAFLLDAVNVTDEYLTLCRTPDYQDKPCLNGAFILRDCTIKYSIPQTAYNSGDGVYLLSETTDNIANLMAITQDGISGRLLGIVSENTNIDDATLNDVVEMYATIYTDYNG